MGTAGRPAPLRRTGSLLGLVSLELAAVLALHWLGSFQGLRIRWDEPAACILSSPVQEVLGAVLRMVGLVMAYWLLASTVAYLLASLTRLPGAVRAVRWATLPVVRRVPAPPGPRHPPPAPPSPPPGPPPRDYGPAPAGQARSPGPAGAPRAADEPA